MKAFILRQAEETTGDISLINKLALQVWNNTYAGIHSQEQLDYMFEQMYSPENLLGQMQKGHVFFIGYEAETPVGYVSVERKDEHLFCLQKLYVLPSYQGTGAGKFLFLEAINYIKKIHQHPCTLELNVNRQNPAIRFYEHMGMKRYRESDEPIGNGYVMNCLYMRMDITVG